MASDPTETLIQFIADLLDDIKATPPRISPEEAIVVIKNNGYLRRHLGDYVNLLTLDTLVDKQSLQHQLVAILEHAQAQQQFLLSKVAEDDLVLPTLNPSEVSSRAKSFAVASTISYTSIKKQRRKFIESLVVNLTKQYALSAQSQQRLIQSVDDSVLTSSSTAISNLLARTLETIPEISTLSTESKTRIQQSISVSLDSNSQSAARVASEIVQYVGPRPDAFAYLLDKRIDQHSAFTLEDVERSIEETRPAIRAYEALTARLPTQEEIERSAQAVSLPFFGSFATTPIQKMAAGVADTILNTGSAQTKSEVIEKTMAKAVLDVNRDPRFRREIGEDFFGSPYWNEIVQNARNIYGREPSKTNLWVDRMLSNRFSTSLLGTPTQYIQDIVRLERAGLTISQLHAPVSLVRTAQPTLDRAPIVLPIHTDALMRLKVVDLYIGLLRYGAPEAFSSAFHFEFITQAAGFGIRFGAEKVISEGGKVVIKGAAAKLAGSALGTLLAGPLGTIVGWVGTDLVMSGFGKIFSGIRGGLARLDPSAILSGRQGPPKKWYNLSLEDGVAVVAVGSLLLLMFLGSTTTSTIQNAFATSVPKGGAIVSGTPISYTGPPPPSYTAGFICPVAAGGRISQMPGEGDHTGNSADSYDFAISTGTPIRATHDGYVVDARASIPENQFIYGNYGNYIRLVGTDTNGKQFYTTYAHLKDVSASVMAAKGTETLIKAGDIIGISDNTGWSTGPHLHYQYNGSGRVSFPSGCIR